VEQLNRFKIQIEIQDLERKIAEWGTSAAYTVYKRGRGFISDLARVFIHFLFLLVILFYLFLDGPRLRSYLFSLSPRE